MYWYIKVWKNYFNFQGRARRTEYWIFLLFNTFISFLLFTPIEIYASTNNLDNFPILILIISITYIIYSLASIIPSLAVYVRRLHDTNRSGWWSLLIFLPVIGWIWLFICLIQNSTPGENRYGSDPKAPTLNTIEDTPSPSPVSPSSPLS